MMRSLPYALRPYALPDLEPLVACWFHTWHATFAPRRHPQALDAWRRRFREEYEAKAEVWVAGPSGRVAGLMVLFPEAGWLEQLFVHPEAQGRGLGRGLVALARLRCPEGLELDTPVENVRAREFYRRRGFRAREVGFDPVVGRVMVRYGCGGERRLP